MNEIVRDGGMKSRKLWFSVFCVVVVVGAGISAACWPAIAAVYVTLVGGVVAIGGMYLTGNVAQKYVGTKAQPGLLAAAAQVVKPAPAYLADQAEEPAAAPAPRFTED